MPRAKNKGNPQHRTATGEPAQRIASVPGQRYGEGVQMQQLQQTMPAPQVVQPATVPPGGGGGAAAPSAPVAAAPAPTAGAPAPASPPDLLAIAQEMRGRAGLLTAPTARPNEPITAGLPSGPGPGPEALLMRRGSPTADVLTRLAQDTGDSYLLDLLSRSRP